jgi:hypothetical protein
MGKSWWASWRVLLSPFIPESRARNKRGMAALYTRETSHSGRNPCKEYCMRKMPIMHIGWAVIENYYLCYYDSGNMFESVCVCVCVCSFSVQGNIWQCLRCFQLLQLGNGATSISWVEIRLLLSILQNSYSSLYPCNEGLFCTKYQEYQVKKLWPIRKWRFTLRRGEIGNKGKWKQIRNCESTFWKGTNFQIKNWKQPLPAYYH